MIEAIPLDDSEVAIVFGPAVAGYALLSAIAVIAAWSERAYEGLRRRRKALAWAALLIISAHVLLLWTMRFGWDLAVATRNGWIGFASFHVAFTAAWIALPGDWTQRGRRRWVVLGAWLLVTTGAVGAPFRYPIVSSLAVPVVAIAVLGALGVGAAFLRRTPAPT